MRYKIWDYALNQEPLDDQVPDDVNFKTGLSVRLQPKNTIVAGELVEQTLYAEADYDSFGQLIYSIPLVNITWSYTRDASGLAIKRTEVIKWYLDDGTLGTDSKERVKIYNSLAEKRSESERRRRNIVDRATEVTIGGLVQLGRSLPDAISEGKVYFGTVAQEVAAYQNGDVNPLIDRISTDTSPSWVPVLKAAILAELV